MLYFTIALAAATVAVWGVVLVQTRRPATGPQLLGDGVAPVGLALVLVAGALQASPALGAVGDALGIVVSALLTVAMGHALLVGGVRFQFAPIALMALVVALGALRAADTPYGHLKLVHLVLTLHGVAAACLLLTTERRRVRFLWATVAIAVLMGFLTLYSPATDVEAGRVAAQGATTIATSRATGAGVVVLVAWLAARRLRRPWWGAAAVGGLVVLMFATGSRGPLLGVALACLVTLALVVSKHPRRAVTVALAVLTVAWVGWTQAEAVSKDRLAELIADDKGASIGQREFMWGRSWDAALADFPFDWRGWGNLNASTLVVDRHPHNLFLEVIVEAGWLAGVAVVVLLVGGLVRTYRHRHLDSTALPLVGLLVFAVMSAMVSGDVADNRFVFVFAAACWMVGSGTNEADSGEVVDERLHALSKL